MENVLTAVPFSAPESVESARQRRVEWCLRLAAVACFIGHGAFGIITKAAWVPYFGIFGIGQDLAYRLMPVVGTIDILAGLVVLISPRPFVLLYMVGWAAMTALLRPLSGESFFETLERAGNYGVPLALLLTLGWPRSIREIGDRFGGDATRTSRETVGRILLATTSALLFAHGALAAITQKPVFAAHYGAIGLPPEIAPVIGFAEMFVAVLVILAPLPALLVAISFWKVATEALFPVSGAPIWELIERGGSYGAPLALVLLAGSAPFTRITFTRRPR